MVLLSKIYLPLLIKIRNNFHYFKYLINYPKKLKKLLYLHFFYKKNYFKSFTVHFIFYFLILDN